MNKRSILLLFILLAIRVHGAGNVTISGFFPGAEGETLHLMAYEDLVSRQPLHLSSAKIDSTGSFKLTTSLNESRVLFLRVFNAKNYLYAAPGESYLLEYEKLVINDPEQDESRLFRQRAFNVTVYGKNDQQEDLHTLILRMEDMVATYLEEQVAGRVRANHRASLEQFGRQLDSTFIDGLEPFFDDYVKYYMAYLNRSLNVRGFDALFHLYIKDQPILTDHPVYMNFFRSMFDNYVFAGSRSIRMHELENVVNKYPDFEKLMDLLANDRLLQDEALRELVLLITLDRMFAMPDFFNSRLLGILAEASEKCKTPEHRIIAENIKKKHSRGFHEGAIASDFQLSDTSGHVYNLQDFSDSFVYLFFWAGWCPLSMQSISAMEEVAEKFNGQLKVIGVLVDRDRRSVHHFLNDEGFPFQLLHFDGDYGLLENFGVATIPFYMLIGPDGRIIAHPFVPPHWGAQEALDDILGG